MRSIKCRISDRLVPLTTIDNGGWAYAIVHCERYICPRVVRKQTPVPVLICEWALVLFRNNVKITVLTSILETKMTVIFMNSIKL